MSQNTRIDGSALAPDRIVLNKADVHGIAGLANHVIMLATAHGGNVG